MITKKLIKQVTDFHNLYLGCQGIVTNINMFNVRGCYISCDISYWTTNKENTLDKRIKNVSKYIHNETDFLEYKREVIETFKEFKTNVK